VLSPLSLVSGWLPLPRKFCLAELIILRG
jgi:hypothetical protein